MADAPSEKASESVVTGVTRAINDAWNFFFPAAVRLLATVAVARFLMGPEVSRFGTYGILRVRELLDPKGIGPVLDQYKLTPLIPIAMLFFLAALFHAFNRVVSALALLFPVGFTHYPARLLMSHPRSRELWYRIPEAEDDNALHLAVEVEVSKARATGPAVLFSQIEHWKQDFYQHYRRLDFIKFITVWSCLCWFSARKFPDAARGYGTGRLALLLSVSAVAIVIELLQLAYATKERSRAEIDTAMMMLANGKGSVPPERKLKIDTMVSYAVTRKQGWWGVGFGWLRSEWLGTATSFDLIGSLPLTRRVESALRQKLTKRQ